MYLHLILILYAGTTDYGGDRKTTVVGKCESLELSYDGEKLNIDCNGSS
ncbi:MAG: hypothetical protein U5L96_20730 [Owenweeksia sp.]|nr:hypothetical protein [Owenweeksia sp.]